MTVKAAKERVPCPTMACENGRIRWLNFRPSARKRSTYTKCKTCKGRGWIERAAAGKGEQP